MRFADQYKNIPIRKRRQVRNLVHRHIEKMFDEIAKIFFNKRYYLDLDEKDMMAVCGHIKYFVLAYAEDERMGEEWLCPNKKDN